MIQTQLEVPKASRQEVVNKLIDKGNFEEALVIDPSNTIALMRLLKNNAISKKFVKSISLLQNQWINQQAISPNLKTRHRADIDLKNLI